MLFRQDYATRYRFIKERLVLVGNAALENNPDDLLSHVFSMRPTCVDSKIAMPPESWIRSSVSEEREP